ncbi:protein TIC 40, chloroplastic-like isoform X2 [Dioscorea cayenensis subsp. rotundata]|uniref:Protein TIC 40, chloroplastic-like isoform X2 n=1 Tax=Dioscorea cayennensis subsp. rotundata TaxID=55577 RepID=A0AB40B2U9_DIOCR|nr:protein TIC 40, chloroplastic-like isoform X2 [Dioscorea cayenensis subsp. rotundata]
MAMQTVSLLPARPPVLPAAFSSPRAPFYPAGKARRVVSLWIRRAATAPEKLEMQDSANVASQGTVQTITSSINPPQILALPPPSFIGSPLLWIGVGIGISAAFNTMATRLKRMAILKAFKEVMGPNSQQDGTFNTAAFAPGTPFPSPSASPSATTIPTPTASAPGPPVPLDIPKTNVEEIPQHDTSNNTKADKETEGHGTLPASN